MNNYFDNTPLIKVILKWKWHIVIITLVAAVIGAVFSSSTFITPLYKSEAVLYPSNVAAYSDETFTEQMLQIMQSNEIMDSVVEKFDLMKHYKIDKGYKYWKTALIGEYRDKVSISRTPYDAVLIKVKDKDPEIACAMVKEIIRLYDNKVRTLHKIKRFETVNMYKRQLEEKQTFIDSLKSRMAEISTNHGVVAYESQSREVTRGFLRTNDGSKVNEKGVDTMMVNLGQYGPEIVALSALITTESANYAAVKLDYEQELRFYNAQMTFSNVISEPFVADKKCYPVRWVVVALSAIGACLLSVLLIYVFDNKCIKEE
jgi:capsular polysaccharide biosynthesis protein